MVWKFCGKAQFPYSLGESPETLRKLCLSTKIPHQEIRWNYGILRSYFNRIFFFFQNNHSIKHIRKYAFVVHANVEDIHQNQCSLKWAISQNDVERPACYVQHVVIHVLGDRKTNLIQILNASLSENDMLKINKKFVE